MTRSQSQATTAAPTQRLGVPVHGARNPGREETATTPGSFALAPDIGGPLMFASPDTPGMPAPSGKTAWDFMLEGWLVETPSRPESGTSNLKSEISNCSAPASPPCTACESY